jgi:hypothetical protein
MGHVARMWQIHTKFSWETKVPHGRSGRRWGTIIKEILRNRACKRGLDSSGSVAGSYEALCSVKDGIY